MRASIFISRKELEDYLERHGFSIITFRRIVLSEFGYKNAMEFKKDFKCLTDSVLNIKFAYSNSDDYREILLKISRCLQYLRNENEKLVNCFIGRDFIYFDPETSSYNYSFRNETLYYYTVSATFRRNFVSELSEKLGLNDVGIAI